MTEIAALAEEAFVRAYPLLLADRALASGTPNRFGDGAYSPDTLRISAWLDLGPEPIVLEAPDTRGRYYVLWLRDAWNMLFASIGARTTGTGARAFAILGPDRHGAHLPAGLTPILAPTRIDRICGCIEALAGHADPDCERLLDAFRLAPLSRWQDVDADRTATRRAPVEAVDRLDARTFFTEALRLLGDNPAAAEDRAALARLRAVGPLDRWEDLRAEVRASIEDGVRRGQEVIRGPAPNHAGERVGGWRVGYDADQAADELPAVADTDADGSPLSGRDHYVLRFAPDAPPPVNGFWSLTARGDEGGHAIGDLRGLVLDRDGSLPIHIQRAPPARESRANWLEAPPERFSLALRLYWPREEVLQRRWLPPAVTRVVRPE